jgi:hypothetical protein
MKMICLLLAMVLALLPPAAHAQIPPEWKAAAQAVIGDIEQGTPEAGKPWGRELIEGWRMARSWRQHNNGNIEIILAEYLTFTTLCRESGCAGYTIEGKPYKEVAREMLALRARQGDSYNQAKNIHAWLLGLNDPTGAAAKNVALWSRNLDTAAADIETANLYALYWMLARARPTSAEQAATFSRYALFVQHRAWIGDRCLDISHVATVIGAPPDVKNCK